ncbi:helix-hairpin-helix domain-containing protein [Tepidiforma flava]|uniref:Holliday junction branch migration complex subunit RuvA n=1 Tax=Tepidiforma flava TaxID=3004094 RepID=A0ABY7M9P4_9CHLR|nr:Holliday junction branch migration protein RuvA [Tepidiforma flava]WBL37244.1 helix-hairpin-helix domain-containing protein [Tepidiforma flava]
MITHLRGRLARMDLAGPLVELDVHGIRFEILVPIVLWPELAELAGEADLSAGEGPELGLHIFYHVNANNPLPVLVGFLRRAERDFFRKFTTVEGIGPAKAVKAMNVSVSTIARAIEQEDRATLARLPGIGPRSADKIIATLRGKVVAEAALQDGGVERPVETAAFEERRLIADAVEAIAGLGYSRAEARKWVEAAAAEDPSLDSLDAMLVAVLRRLDAR